MKALTFQGEGDVKVREVPKPSVAASNDALIKVTLGAVCGSDLHQYRRPTPCFGCTMPISIAYGGCGTTAHKAIIRIRL